MNESPATELQLRKSWRKRNILVATLGAAVIVGMVWLVRPREPSYQGKALSHWLARYQQVCDSLYYAGMKHKIAGDKQSA